MTKISELRNTTGSNIDSGDIFLTVVRAFGSDGTRSLTRTELFRALEEETFTRFKSNGGIATNLTLNNPNFVGTVELEDPIADGDYFTLRDISSNTTVSFTYSALENSISETFKKSTKIYVSNDDYGAAANGSYFKPYNTLEQAFQEAAESPVPVSISLMPGTYYTNGNLELADNCSVIGTNGQYSTNIVMNEGFEQNNCILVGSGCYVQGISFSNQQLDNFDNPTVGFAVAFRPGALILRSPYIRDISQISNYNRTNIAAPLNPRNSLGGIEDLGGADHPNPLVGRGGGVLLADRAVLNQNSIFPYMLAFGATPRSPNGIGYVAKNGAGINGIGSITIFQRCAFYALNGGQITLNNSGTQFGDISMRARGTIPVVNPAETIVPLVASTVEAAAIDAAAAGIIDSMWAYLVSEGYTVNETFTRRDAANLIQSLSYDVAAGTQSSTRNFTAGLFNYQGELVFNPAASAGSGTLLEAFIDAFDFILAQLIIVVSSPTVETMLDGLIEDVLKETINNPQRLNFGSLIESIGHQFNLAGAGVNKNALPLNFRRVGTPLAASGSVLQEEGGRVRWSGADELNNQYFARGLKINGRTGRLEGRPFTSSVRRLARRAANSRTFT